MRQDGILTVRDYLEVFRRRRLSILLVALLGVALAFVYGRASGKAEPLYRASADGLLDSGAAPGSLDSSPSSASEPQALRIAQTQADVASGREVAKRVLAATKTGDMSPEEFLESASVSPKTGSAFLTFSAIHPNQAQAIRLATQFARQALLHRKQLEAQSLRRARRELERRIASLRRQQPIQQDEPRPLLDALVEKLSEVRTLEALQAGSTLLVQPARVTPVGGRSWVRLLGLGYGLGLFLGVLAAFVRESLDTRIRSAAAAASELRLPLLGSVPYQRRRMRVAQAPAMVAAPSSIEAEAFRKLRATIQVVARRSSMRSLMVTSAIAEEGKSTVVANLGVAFARAGHHVIVVDLDVRSPSLQQLFVLDDTVGLTDVVSGRVSLDRALTTVDVSQTSAPAISRGMGPFRRTQRAQSDNDQVGQGGRLEVLTTGRLTVEPGEFVGDERVAQTIGHLTDRADLILIDTPPLLSVSDALSLSVLVDAVLVVVQVRQRTLSSHLVELERALAICPAAKLGVVAIGARERDESHSYYQEPTLDQPHLALADARAREAGR